MKIYFVRHGEAMDDLENRYGGWYDPDLSPKGITQAEETALKLQNRNIEANLVLTSPLLRAVRTAAVIGKALGISVEQFVYLKERNTYGLLCGENKEEAKRKYPELVDAYENGGELPGYERYDALIRRVALLLRKLSEFEQGPIVCVTHGKLLGAIFKDFLHKEAKRFEDNCLAELEISNSGDIRLVSSDGISFI